MPARSPTRCAEDAERARRAPTRTADGRPVAHDGDGVIEQRFCYDRGLVDYVEHLNRRKDKAHPSVIDFEAELHRAAA